LEEQDAAGSKVHLLPSVLPKGVAKKTPASVICKDHYGITGFENRLPQSKIIYPIPSVTPAVTLLELKWIEYIYYHTLLTVWIVFFFQHSPTGLVSWSNGNCVEWILSDRGATVQEDDTR
jgi:hypothetical protein